MSQKRRWPGREGEMYHLAPTAEWEQQRDGASYTPAAYEADGFIHCTIGVENLIAVGNLFYQADHRPYLALVIDAVQVKAEIRFDDDTGIYPHIYGVLPVHAVVAEYQVVRAADGSFMELVREP